MSEDNRTGLRLTLLGGIGAAIVSGVIAYSVARIQSDAAIQAAIESRSEPLSAYAGNSGIWILGSRDKKVVFCSFLPGEPQGDLRNKRPVSCSEPEFVGTY